MSITGDGDCPPTKPGTTLGDSGYRHADDEQLLGGALPAQEPAKARNCRGHAGRVVSLYPDAFVLYRQECH